MRGAECAWEVVDAYVGSATAHVPIASLLSEPIRVEVEEVLLTVRPRPLAAAGSVAARGTAAAQPPPPSAAGDAALDMLGDLAAGAVCLRASVLQGRNSLLQGVDAAASAQACRAVLLGAGAARVTDGAQLIAGSLESLLQQLRVSARNAVVHLQLPAAPGGLPAPLRPERLAVGAAGTVVVLQVDEVLYGPSTSDRRASHPSPPTLAKLLSFSGLTLDVKGLPDSCTAADSCSSGTAGSSSSGGPSGMPGTWADGAASGAGAGASESRAVLSGGDGGRGLAGRVEVQLTAAPPQGPGPAGAPRLAGSVALQRMRVELCSHHLMLLASSAAALSAALAPASDVRAAGRAAHRPSPPRCGGAPRGHTGPQNHRQHRGRLGPLLNAACYHCCLLFKCRT